MNIDWFELTKQMPIATVLVFILIQSTNEHRRIRKELADERKSWLDLMQKKDKDIGVSNQKVLQLSSKSLSTMNQMGKVIEANTQSTDKLVENFDFILRNSKYGSSKHNKGSKHSE
jgi:hypothetical protein